VTIITAAFPPVGGGGVMRMAKLAKYLPELGWDVTVVCGDAANPEVVDPVLRAEIPASIDVRTVPGPFRLVGSRAERVTDAGSASKVGPTRRAADLAKAAARSLLIPDRYLGWAWRVSRLGMADLGHPAVILSSGPPHSAHLAASSLAVRHHVPLVMDLRDDWADNPMHVNPAPWHRPIEWRLERRCVGRAAGVVHVSEQSRAVLQARYPSRAGRFWAITNGFDAADLVELPERRAVAPDQVIRFLYAGSLRGIQDVGLFLEVFGRAARAHGRLHLDLLGPVEPRFRDLAHADIHPDHVRVTDGVPHAAALREMAEADVLLVFIGGGGAGADTMTGKLFEYIALRRPILLVGPPGPAADLVAGSGAGVVAHRTALSSRRPSRGSQVSRLTRHSRALQTR
jgi:glycosyltransferase involved in cell wall biosynthesis